jgi:hypothetical protein
VPAPPRGRAILRILPLAAYTAIYFPVVIAVASKKLLWNDELFSVVMSSRPFADTWRLLAAGADQMPPAFYAVTHWALSLFSPLELAVRAPEILGFWLLGLCLFELTARRTSLFHGAIAALLPCAAQCFTYAFEARAYGMVLGFTALALLLWQRANEEGPRRWALVAFAMALMAATAVHYYAVFVLFPFAAAEAWHWWRERRFRPAVWLAIGSGVLPILLALPLLRVAGQVAHAFWARAQWHSIDAAYHELLGNGFMVGLTAAAAVGFLALLLSRPHSGREFDLWRPPVHELIPVALLAALPIIVVAAAKATIGAFTPRYAIAFLPGFCVLIVWAFYLFTAHRPRLTAVVAAALLVTLGVRGARIYRHAVTERRQVLALANDLAQSQPQSLPLVVSDPHQFFELWHYAPPRLASRMLYVADLPTAVHRTGTDTVDSGMLALGPVSGARVARLDPFLKSTSQFLLYGYPADWEWLVPELVARQTPLRIVQAYQDKFLFLAGPGEPAR